MSAPFRLSRRRIVPDRKRRTLSLTLALGLTWPVMAGAGAAPPVDELVDEALRSNPSIQAQAHHVAGVRAAAEATGGPSSVMVGVGLQDIAFPRWTVGDEEMSMIGPEVSVSLPWPGTGGARRRAAESEADGMAADLETIRRRVVRDVRTRYGRVYAIDRRAASLREAIDLTAGLEQALRGRMEVGQAGAEDVFRASLTRNRLEEELDDLTVERAAEVAELNRLLDRPAGSDLGPVEALPPVAFPPAPWDSLATAGSAEIGARQAGITMAQRGLRAAQLDLKPMFQLGAGYGWRGRHADAVNLRIGVELPALGGLEEKPEERHARERLHAAHDDLRDAEAGARSEAARLQVAVERNEAQARRHRTETLPAARTAFESSRAAYESGRGGFGPVVDMLAMWLESEAGLARREAERFELWADLQNLIAPAPPAGGETR